MLHNLGNKWSFWFLRGERSADDNWEKNLFKIATFETIEDYFGIIQSIIPPSNLVPGTDYYFFRDGIKPMWEEKGNKNGGRWCFLVHGKDGKFLNDLFTKICDLLMSGQFIDFENEICGIALNVRGKHDKVSLWIKDASDPVNVETIGMALKYLVGYQFKISFELHADAVRRNGSFKFVMHI